MKTLIKKLKKLYNDIERTSLYQPGDFAKLKEQSNKDFVHKMLDDMQTLVHVSSYIAPLHQMASSQRYEMIKKNLLQYLETEINTCEAHTKKSKN